MDESFFLLIARTGGSAISISSVALTISNCSFGYSYAFNVSFSISSFPTNRTFMSFRCFIAFTAPFTISCGALSPPIASRATIVVSDIFFPPHITVYNSIKKMKKKQGLDVTQILVIIHF